MATQARLYSSDAAGTKATTVEKLVLGHPPRVWAMRSGHAAFVMLASMYLMTDMVLLRVLGIAANGLDMFYCFLVAETPLWLNIRWGAFYVLINVVQLAQIYWDQRTLKLDPVQAEVYESYFQRHGMTQPQFVKLYRLATTRDFAVGEAIVSGGEGATTVTLVLDGSVELQEHGVGVAQQEGGSWIGAAEFLATSTTGGNGGGGAAGEGATTAAGGAAFELSARATTTVRALEWSAAELRSCCSRNPSLALPLQSTLSEEVKTELGQHQKFARLAAYRAVLAGVWADETVTEDEHAFLLRYRHAHTISALEHEQAMTSIGISPQAYDTARKHGHRDLNHYYGTVAGVLADDVVELEERQFLRR